GSRGLAPLGVRRGYSKHSTTHSRPRSSTVNAIGLMTSGSAANRVTSKPGGTRIRRSDSSGGRYGCPAGRVLSKPKFFWAGRGRGRARQARVRGIAGSTKETGGTWRRLGRDGTAWRGAAQGARRGFTATSSGQGTTGPDSSGPTLLAATEKPTAAAGRFRTPGRG